MPVPHGHGLELVQTLLHLGSQLGRSNDHGDDADSFSKCVEELPPNPLRVDDLRTEYEKKRLGAPNLARNNFLPRRAADKSRPVDRDPLPGCFEPARDPVDDLVVLA